VNSLAASIVNDATDEAPPPSTDRKGQNPATVSLGRRGGLKGGRARANKLIPEQRSAIARKAAPARWALDTIVTALPGRAPYLPAMPSGACSN
jgi:hypothetical protein